MDSQEELDVKSADALAQSLCRGCGLCCDGTLFEFAKIQPEDDLVQMEKSGITTISDDGKRFYQPCKPFDQVCTIYHQRPGVCMSYTCKLLKRCNKSEISYENASKIISETKAQKERAHASFSAAGVDGTGCLVRQYSSLKEKLAESKTRACIVAEFDYSVLQILLNRHFRKNTKHGVVANWRAGQIDAN